MMFKIKHKPGARMPNLGVALLFLFMIAIAKLVMAKSIKVKVFFSPHLSGYELPSHEQADWNKLGGTSTFPWRRKKTKTGHQNSDEHLAVWRYYNHQFQVSDQYKRHKTDLQVPSTDQITTLNKSRQGLDGFYRATIYLPLSHTYPAFPWFGGTNPVPGDTSVIYFIKLKGLVWRV